MTLSLLGIAAGFFIGYVLSLFLFIIRKLKTATKQTVIAG
jgi:hypothetical protein